MAQPSNKAPGPSTDQQKMGESMRNADHAPPGDKAVPEAKFQAPKYEPYTTPKDYKAPSMKEQWLYVSPLTIPRPFQPCIGDTCISYPLWRLTTFERLDCSIGSINNIDLADCMAGSHQCCSNVQSLPFCHQTEFDVNATSQMDVGNFF